MALTASESSTAPRRVTVLGSTGSVGCSTIDLLEREPEAYDIEPIAMSNGLPSRRGDCVPVLP